MIKNQPLNLRVHHFLVSIICGLMVLICLSFLNKLNAQTVNYWSWNFNTPSTLLAGAVVGGGSGPSSIYYNPALINFDNVASLSISANIFSFQFFKINNIAGDGLDVSNIKFKIQPRFLSYVLPSKNKKLGMEFAFISPVTEDIEYTLQHFDEIDIIERMEGLETYSGYLNYGRKYDDTWGGFGLSYEFSKRFYIGGSSFFSYKSLKYHNIRSASAFQESDSVYINQVLEPSYFAQNSFTEELNYWDASMIFKFGLHFLSENEQLSFGVNITSPNIPIMGRADVRKDYEKSDVFDNESDSFTPNEILIEHEESVKTRIKTPFSVALGFQYLTKNKNNFFSLTVEYFHNIEQYSIIETTDTNNKLPNYFDGLIGENDFLPYYFEARSVTNIAFGLKQYLTPTVYIFGGFRTDFSAAVEDNFRFSGNTFKVSQLQLNKYHFTIGPVLTIKRSEVVTGIQYTFGGNKNFPNVINYKNPVEYIPLTGQSLEGIRMNNASTSINELSLFLGITVDLFKKKNDSEEEKQF